MQSQLSCYWSVNKKRWYRFRLVIESVAEHSTNKSGPSPPSFAPFFSHCTPLGVGCDFSARLSTSLVAVFQVFFFLSSD